MESSHYRVVGTGRLPFAPQFFAIGETVRVKKRVCVRYVRVPATFAKDGHDRARLDTNPFPDAAGHNMPAEIEPTYDVRFRARDLWPDTSDEALESCSVFKVFGESRKCVRTHRTVDHDLCS